jgi:hypothetical protein
VPWSKPPNSLLRVAMRPPAPVLFSNTVTSRPACISVRAQAMPAIPAPTTAIFRIGRLVFLAADAEEDEEDEEGEEEAVRGFFVMSFYFF